MKKVVLVIAPNFPTQFKSAINWLPVDKYSIVGLCHHNNIGVMTRTEGIQVVTGVPIITSRYEPNAVEYTSGLLFLKGLNIIPNIILVHVGFGIEFGCKIIFPGVPIIGYFEWYFGFNLTDNTLMNVNCIYKSNLISQFAEKCSVLITPTEHQRSKFPDRMKNKLQLLHEGVDINFYKPPIIPLDIPNKKTITYVSRGLEPIRGFMEFINMIKLLLEAPKSYEVDVIVIGRDEVVYTDNPDKISYLTKAQELLGPELLKHVQFKGNVVKDEILQTFQSSDLHVYYTEDFVPSWSLLEAMACGCVVLMSGTPTLAEFNCKQYTNCFTTDHKNYEMSKQMAMAILQAEPEKIKIVRENARRFIVENYDSAASEKTWQAILGAYI